MSFRLVTKPTLRICRNLLPDSVLPNSANSVSVVYPRYIHTARPYNRISYVDADFAVTDVTERKRIQQTVVDFRDFKRAYGSVSLWNITQSLLIFRMCSFSWLLDNGSQLIKWSRRLSGPRLFNAAMKSTFYRQFVGGETLDDLQTVIARLRSVGVGPMLCVPIEEDVGEARNAEVKYDNNLSVITECIETSGKVDQVYPMSQLKLTALIPASFCSMLSVIMPDPHQHTDKLDEVVQYLKYGEGNFDHLTNVDREIMKKSLNRLKTIAEQGASRGVRLVIDAEYTYLNPALRFFALAMMLAYNTSSPLVAYTYQNYLKVTYSELKADETLVMSRGACFGLKLVRGAYMEKERSMAAKQGYTDPVHATFEDTSKMYEASVDYLLERVSENPEKYFVMVATHNEQSVKHALQRMEDLNIYPSSGSVFFGQIYGMCDYISNTLGLLGHNVYKSIPYGSVDDTLPYLHRRALENKSVLGGTRVERELLWKTLVNRTSFGLIYK